MSPHSPLTVQKILAWADAHRARTGSWPTADGGAVPTARGETWNAINLALRDGYRGLPGGSSLSDLLARRRGKTRRYRALTVEQVLRWADAHRRRTGEWPRQRSGPVEGVPGLLWRGVDEALRAGYRGLPGGDSLARLLTRRRVARNPAGLPALTPRQILEWADAHHAHTGTWPSAGSGPVSTAPGESWGAVNMALYEGRRGLPGGDSLARLLDRTRRERVAS